MNILYLTPSFQHPTLRGPARHYYFIRELSRRHQITLLSLTKAQILPEAMEEMKGYAKSIHTFSANGVTTSTWLETIGRVPAIGKRLKTFLQFRAGVTQMKQAFLKLVNDGSYDLVLFHGKPIFRVIEDWNALPIVADFCDATSMRYRFRMRTARWFELPALMLRYLRIRRVEKKLMNKTSHVAFISYRDRSALLASKNDARIIPLGIDLEYWKRQSGATKPNCLIFTGVMDYQPNAEAANYLIDKILPRLRQAMPRLELFIVGRNPSAGLMEKARDVPGVAVTGFVDDLRPYLERATVYVAPVFVASGTQNKVVEALAMQVPTVATPVVYDGLRVSDDSKPPVWVASTEKEFAEQIIRLLMSPGSRELLKKDGRSYVEHHFDWVRSAAMLEEMCQSAMEAKLRAA
jgi:glycosyltransferase involved in cell wall biosynthesis